MVVSPTDLFLFARVFVHGSDICAKMFLCGPEIFIIIAYACYWYPFRHTGMFS